VALGVAALDGLIRVHGLLQVSDGRATTHNEKSRPGSERAFVAVDEGSAHGGEVSGRMSGRLNRVSAVAPWGDVSRRLPRNNIRAIAARDHVGRRSSWDL
jgi:hypothetical protein